MKKRAIEAAAVFAAVAVLFLIINLIAGGTAGSTVKIDGEHYSIGDSSLTLTLMTEDGLENLSAFKRLDYLKIIPYKAAVVNSVNYDDPEVLEAVRRETEKAYPDCTDVEDISFLRGLDTVKQLDISFCGVSELSPLKEMQSLSAVNISFTPVEDISVLAELEGVTEVIMRGIEAADYSPLLKIKGLKRLRIDEGQVSGDIISQLSQRGVEISCAEKTADDSP